MYKEKINEMLSINQIDTNMFYKLVYDTIINSIFVFVCKEINKKGNKIEEKEKFRKFENKTIATKCLVSRYLKTNISDEEYRILAQYFNAYFSKNDSRKQFDNEIKEVLIKDQDCKCVVCKSYINQANAHLDHIIAWDFVGDKLLNNYQMLCETCNERKSNYTGFELSNILVRKK